MKELIEFVVSKDCLYPVLVGNLYQFLEMAKEAEPLKMVYYLIKGHGKKKDSLLYKEIIITCINKFMKHIDKKPKKTTMGGDLVKMLSAALNEE